MAILGLFNLWHRYDKQLKKKRKKGKFDLGFYVAGGMDRSTMLLQMCPVTSNGPFPSHCGMETCTQAGLWIDVRFTV